MEKTPGPNDSNQWACFTFQSKALGKDLQSRLPCTQQSLSSSWKPGSHSCLSSDWWEKLKGARVKIQSEIYVVYETISHGERVSRFPLWVWCQLGEQRSRAGLTPGSVWITQTWHSELKIKVRHNDGWVGRWIWKQSGERVGCAQNTLYGSLEELIKMCKVVWVGRWRWIWEQSGDG